MNPDLEILKAALSSAGDANALARVRARAEAIREAMDNDDVDLTAAELEYLGKHGEWVGEVYAALGDDLESGEDSAIAQAIEKLRENEDTEIGEAFVALMEQLAACRYDWKERFRSLRFPDPASPEWAGLLNDPTVLAAGNYGYQLISHTGLTPSMIYEATRGLHLLFERVVSALEESRPEEKWLKDRPTHEVGFRILAGETVASIPNQLVLAEIAGTPDLPEDAVQPLCNWIMDVLSYQPFLIEGYLYIRERRAFRQLAQPDVEIPDDLIAQWSQSDRRTTPTRRRDRVAPESTRRSY